MFNFFITNKFTAILADVFKAQRLDFARFNFAGILQFNEILYHLISITNASKKGRLSNEEKLRRKVEVLEQLNGWLDSADERINSRLNTARSTDAVTPQRILRLLQGEFFSFS